MVLLTVENVTKSYGSKLILDKVSFQIDDKHKIGLVGLNGVGKTTLFKIILNDIYYDSGNISKMKDLEIGYISQDNYLDSDDKLYDELCKAFEIINFLDKRMHEVNEMLNKSNEEEEIHKLSEELDHLHYLYNRHDGYKKDANIKKIISGLGFTESDLEKKVSNFSGGQKNRIALAKILLQNPQLLLLDEPTNYLDISAIVWLENYLKNFDGAYMIISHDRYFLNRTVDYIYELENKKIKIYRGNYDKYREIKEKSIEQQTKRYELQQEFIEKEMDFIRRNIAGQNTKQAKSRIKRLEKIELIEKPSEIHNWKFYFKEKRQSGIYVLKVENLAIGYDEKNKILENINFEITRGDKVAIIGRNGSGKSTLIKTIVGEIKELGGKLTLGHNVDLAYYSQEHEVLNFENDLVTEIKLSNEEFLLADIQNYLGYFGFSNDDIYKKVSQLSGGERSRLLLAKIIAENGNFLILDEPTNHLDFNILASLEKGLKEYTGTILIVSHDRFFINELVNKIIYFDEKNEVKIFNGTFAEFEDKYFKYEELINRENIIKEDNKENLQIFENKKKEKNKIKSTIQKLEKLISNLEEEISIKETELENIRQELSNEEIYKNIEKLNTLVNKEKKLQNEIDELYKEWDNANNELLLFNEENKLIN